MAVFKCRICGGTVEFEEGATVGVCDSCGTKQTLQELEKGRDADVPAEENPVGIAPLLKRVFMFLEDGDWRSANEYCEKVLDQDPENAQAYLGKLMAECRVHKQENLKNCPVPFDVSNNYKKVVRFADPELVKKLENDLVFINERNEEARINGIYDSAVRALESAKTEQDCKAAAETFRTIPGYRDADARVEQCLEKAEACRKDEIYASGKAKMNDSDGLVSAYEKAIEIFQKIPGWGDADRQIELCRQKIQEIEDNRLKQKLKLEALQAVQDAADRRRNRIVTIGVSAFVAIFVFFSLLTKVIIPSVRYNSAMNLYNAGDYQEAYEAFHSMSYKDSEEMAEKSFHEMNYHAALDFYNAEKYKEAFWAFHDMEPYRDSLEKAEECMGLMQKKSLSFFVVGDIVQFGSYEQDNNLENGKEPIDWIVLEIKRGKALIVSQYALDAWKPESREGWYAYVSWSNSSLRRRLTDDFLPSAFSEEDQDKIAPVMIEGKTDEIFLLSIAQAEQYFKTTTDQLLERRCAPTVYAKKQGVYEDSYQTANGKGTCHWWLRTDVGNCAFAYVRPYGTIYDNYSAKTEDNYTYTRGVRPALWINLES